MNRQDSHDAEYQAWVKERLKDKAHDRADDPEYQARMKAITEETMKRAAWENQLKLAMEQEKQRRAVQTPARVVTVTRGCIKAYFDNVRRKHSSEPDLFSVGSHRTPLTWLRKLASTAPAFKKSRRMVCGNTPIIRKRVTYANAYESATNNSTDEPTLPLMHHAETTREGHAFKFNCVPSFLLTDAAVARVMDGDLPCIVEFAPDCFYTPKEHQSWLETLTSQEQENTTNEPTT